MMPVDQSLRGGEPMWAAEFDDAHPGTGYWYPGEGWDNVTLTGGFATTNRDGIVVGFQWALDHGDLTNANDPTRSVGSFDTGWLSDHTLDLSGATGLDLLVAFYQDCDIIYFNATFPAGYYEPAWITGFSWDNLPGEPGGPGSGGYAGWILPSGDLTNAGDPNTDPNAPYDWSFSLDSADLDAVAGADFGYAHVILDPLDADLCGWWVGDEADPLLISPGATDGWVAYALVQDPNLDPNDPNAYFFFLSQWGWFGGAPFAQCFIRIWAVGEVGCPAECSTSLDADCDVDFDDLNILLSVYTIPPSNPGHPADFGPPAGVDFDDLNLLLSQYNNNCDAP
jgi:hypothetical protein